jgi:hypothetical protein
MIDLVEEAITIDVSKNEEYYLNLNELAAHLQINLTNGCHLGRSI